MTAVGRKIIRGVLGGAGLAAVTAAVGLVQIPLVLHFLPKDLAGVWFLFLSIGVYVSFFDLGVSPTLSREIGFALGAGDLDEKERWARVSDLLATCARIFGVIAAAVLALGLAGGGFFLRRAVDPALAGQVSGAWAVFVLGAAVSILGASPLSALYGLGHVGTERMLKAAGLALGLLLSVAALGLGFGIAGLAAAWAAQNAAVRVAARFLLVRYHPALRTVPGAARRDVFRTIAWPSLKWAGMGLGALLILYSDNPIIAAVMGPDRIPPYEAAMKVVSTLMSLSLILSTSAVPFISRAFAAGEMDACRDLLSRNLRFGMAAMLFLTSFLAVFGRPLVEAWLGEGRFVGEPVLWLLLLVLTLECHHVICATAVMAAGRVVFFWPALIAGALKIGFSLWWARDHGLFGVALGTLAAQLLTNNWFAPFMALKVFHIRPADYALRILAPLAAFGALAAAAQEILFRVAFSPASPLLSLALCLALSAAVAAAAAGLVATAAERKAVWNLWRRAGSAA